MTWAGLSFDLQVRVNIALSGPQAPSGNRDSHRSARFIFAVCSAFGGQMAIAAMQTRRARYGDAFRVIIRKISRFGLMA